jgi:MoxR-like ATPase
MMEAVPKLIEHIRLEMGKVVVGQEELKTQCVMALLCQGSVLLEGVPGVAKTLAVKTLSRLLRLEFQRVQATSDLMPSDIVGTNVLNMANSTFQLHQGPIFTDLLLVDEVNRMPPRTQAALLECMEEHQVTIDGTRYQLSQFFTVFATQNPIEFEGTYPLPEAQLDRFLLKIRVPYPEEENEVKLLGNVQNGFESRELDKAGLVTADVELLKQAQIETKSVKVQESLFKYIVQIARRTREWPALSLGASPRAAVSLMAVAKAVAAIDGRDYLIPDDVKHAAKPVLRHRIVLKPEADLEGVTPDQVLQDVLRAVEVPK